MDRNNNKKEERIFPIKGNEIESLLLIGVKSIILFSVVLKIGFSGMQRNVRKLKSARVTAETIEVGDQCQKGT
jgi:hypothetical protein